LGAVVIDQVGLKTADEAYFSDLFLSLHALSDFVLFGEVRGYFGGLILVVFVEPDIFLVLDFHKG
jgi:hypothetical protein